jgi:hypothetical protein
MPDNDFSPISIQTVWLVIKHKNSSVFLSAVQVPVGEALPALPSHLDSGVYEMLHIPTLEGLTPEPMPKSALQILESMRKLFSSQNVQLQYEFRQIMAEVHVAATGNNIPLMRYMIGQLDFANSQTVTPTQGLMLKAAFLSCF